MRRSKYWLLSTYTTGDYPKLLCPVCKTEIKQFYYQHCNLSEPTLFNSIGACPNCNRTIPAMELIHMNSPEKDKEITVQKLEILLDKNILSFEWASVIRNAVDLIKGSA